MDPSIEISDDDDLDNSTGKHISSSDFSFKNNYKHFFASYAHFRRSINVLSISNDLRFDTLTFKEKLACNLVANPDSLLPEDEDIILNSKVSEHLPVPPNICPNASY